MIDSQISPETQMELEVIAALVADLDSRDDHILGLVECALSRAADTMHLTEPSRRLVTGAITGIRQILADEIPFEQGYREISRAVDELRRRTGLVHSQEVETDQGCATSRLDTSNPELSGVVSEMQEYLYSAEVALLALEKEPENKAYLNEVFRCFHNIKGIAGFVSLTDFQTLAHCAESLMDLARSGNLEFKGQTADIVFRAVDTFGEMVSRVRSALQGEAYGVPPSYATVLSDLGAAAKPGAQPAIASALSRVHSIQALEPREPEARIKVEELIKVSTARLDGLVDAVGELVIASSMVTQEPEIRVAGSPRLKQNVGRMVKIIRELQELAMAMRMVPLEATFNKMARAARDLSVKMAVPVEFTYSGEETELDRSVVDEINSPLIHMVRNAIDHGIEPPEVRLQVGKSGAGHVHLSACHEGGNVVIRVEDDGRGLDKNKILTKARSIGLIRGDKDLTDREIFNLIFQAGFSTAATVSDISGRGVGMDIVKRAVDKLQGRIDITSDPGRGTTFTIRLPLTMAIIDGMVVTVGNERYIIPTIAIHESLRPTRQQITSVLGRGEMLNIRGRQIPMFRLHRLFDVSGARENPFDALALLIGDSDAQCAIMVDDLVGQQQVVVKPAGKMFGSVEGVSGAAIMGDGLVRMILDAAGIIRMARMGPRRSA